MPEVSLQSVLIFIILVVSALGVLLQLDFTRGKVSEITKLDVETINGEALFLNKTNGIILSTILVCVVLHIFSDTVDKIVSKVKSLFKKD